MIYELLTPLLWASIMLFGIMLVIPVVLELLASVMRWIGGR